MKIIILFCTLFCSFLPRAFSFPEMIRYGYVNCSSCHISPNGGGILNDYGRALSREELAMWKSGDEKSKEPLFAYGALSDTSISKWLKGGGDVRSVYVYQNDASKKVGRTIFMQGDLEMAAVVNQWSVVGAFGAQQFYKQDTEFLSRKHYILYAIDDHWNIRGGKFIPTYGILTPDHVTLVRDPLRMGYGFETYNLELSYISEQWNFFGTGNFGRPADIRGTLDQGFSLQAAYAPTEKMKLGVNTWYGKNTTYHRWLYGVFGLFALSDHLFFSTEVDYQVVELQPSKGLASTQRLSYELMDGLWLYGNQEYGKFDFMTPQSENEIYGMGLQIFPRAHFEFNIAYEYKRNRSVQNDFYDYAYLMSHFYL